MASGYLERIGRLLSRQPRTLDIELQDGKSWSVADLEKVVGIGNMRSRLESIDVAMKYGSGEYVMHVKNGSIKGVTVEIAHPEIPEADNLTAALAQIMNATWSHNPTGTKQIKTRFTIHGAYGLNELIRSFAAYRDKGIGEPTIVSARAIGVEYPIFKKLNNEGLNVAISQKKED